MGSLRRVVWLALAVGGLCLGCGGRDVDYGTREISVNGLAEVEVVPDRVTLGLGVDTLDKDPVKSQADNDRSVKAVLAVVKALGVADEDVQTGYVSLARRERETEEGLLVFEGYQASTTLIVRLLDLSKYNALISGAVKAGAGRVQGLSFECSQEAGKRREARLLAIRAAKQKAQELAAELGQKIGRPLSIDQRDEEPYETSYATGGLFGDESYDEEGTTMAPGRQIIRSGVSVTFELLD
ncbi:MAG TPA: SIMPL domain-containing protein [Planctomycetota bacterium]|nr:SIMPL domain-containing protein [Planctomycetota bacterium]